MDRWTVLIAALVLVTLVALGCSGGGGNPVTPTSAPDVTLTSNFEYGEQHESSVTKNTGMTQLWGFMDVYFDLESATVDVVPNHTVAGVLNAVNFYNNNPVYFSIANLVLTMNVIPGFVDADVDVRLQHPFGGVPKFSGQDVQLVLITDQSAILFDGSKHGVNGSPVMMIDDPVNSDGGGPDGFTRWYNPTEYLHFGTLTGYSRGKIATDPLSWQGDATLNPYKLYIDGMTSHQNAYDFVETDTTHNIFASGNQPVPRNMYIRFQLGDVPVIKINYAIVATWNGKIYPTPSNNPAAVAAEAVQTDSVYYNGVTSGGQLIADISLAGWGYQPSVIVIESSVLDNPYTLDALEMTPSGGDVTFSTYSFDAPASTSLSATVGHDMWIIAQYNGANMTYQKYGFNDPQVPTDQLAAYFRFPVNVLTESPNDPPVITVDLDGCTSPSANNTYTYSLTANDGGDGPGALSFDWEVQDPSPATTVVYSTITAVGSLDLDWGTNVGGSIGETYTIFCEVSDTADVVSATPLACTLVADLVDGSTLFLYDGFTNTPPWGNVWTDTSNAVPPLTIPPVWSWCSTGGGYLSEEGCLNYQDFPLSTTGFYGIESTLPLSIPACMPSGWGIYIKEYAGGAWETNFDYGFRGYIDDLAAWHVVDTLTGDSASALTPGWRVLDWTSYLSGQTSPKISYRSIPDFSNNFNGWQVGWVEVIIGSTPPNLTPTVDGVYGPTNPATDTVSNYYVTASDPDSGPQPLSYTWVVTNTVPGTGVITAGVTVNGDDIDINWTVAGGAPLYQYTIDCSVFDGVDTVNAVTKNVTLVVPISTQIIFEWTGFNNTFTVPGTSWEYNSSWDYLNGIPYSGTWSYCSTPPVGGGWGWGYMSEAGCANYGQPSTNWYLATDSLGSPMNISVLPPGMEGIALDWTWSSVYESPTFLNDYCYLSWIDWPTGTFYGVGNPMLSDPTGAQVVGQNVSFVFDRANLDAVGFWSRSDAANAAFDGFRLEYFKFYWVSEQAPIAVEILGPATEARGIISNFRAIAQDFPSDVLTYTWGVFDTTSGIDYSSQITGQGTNLISVDWVNLSPVPAMGDAFTIDCYVSDGITFPAVFPTKPFTIGTTAAENVIWQWDALQANGPGAIVTQCTNGVNSWGYLPQYFCWDDNSDYWSTAYDNSSVDVIMTPGVTVPSGVTNLVITIDHWYYTANSLDCCLMGYSINGGGTWRWEETTIAPGLGHWLTYVSGQGFNAANSYPTLAVCNARNTPTTGWNSTSFRGLGAARYNSPFQSKFSTTEANAISPGVKNFGFMLNTSSVNSYAGGWGIRRITISRQ